MKCKRSRDWGTRFVGCSGLVEKVDALGQTTVYSLYVKMLVVFAFFMIFKIFVVLQLLGNFYMPFLVLSIIILGNLSRFSSYSRCHKWCNGCW